MGNPVKIDDLARRLIKLSGNKIKTKKTVSRILVKTRKSRLRMESEAKCGKNKENHG